MAPKNVTSGAVQADCDVCNLLAAPTQGCAAGDGLHITIPVDWQTRILSGQSVPGCTYFRLDPVDGSLRLSSLAQANLSNSALVNAMSLPRQTQVAALLVKLTTAQLETGAG